MEFSGLAAHAADAIVLRLGSAQVMGGWMAEWCKWVGECIGRALRVGVVAYLVLRPSCDRFALDSKEQCSDVSTQPCSGHARVD